MYSRLDPLTLLIAIIMVVVVAAPTLIYLGSDGRIIIQKPYQHEYEQAHAQLEQCIERKTPSCAPCQCKPGVTGIVWGVFGAMMMIGGVVTSGIATKRMNKLTELEDKHNKKKKKSRG